MTDRELLQRLDSAPQADALGAAAAAVIDREIPGREIAVDPKQRQKQQDDARRQQWFDRLLDEVNSGPGARAAGGWSF